MTVRKQKAADLKWATSVLSTVEKRGTTRIPFDDGYMATRTKAYFMRTCLTAATKGNHREYLRLMKKITIKQDKNVLVFTAEDDPQNVGRGIINDYFFAPDDLDKGMEITSAAISKLDPEDLILTWLMERPGIKKGAGEILKGTGLKGKISAGSFRGCLTTLIKIGYIQQSGNGKMGTTYYAPGVQDDPPF